MTPSHRADTSKLAPGVVAPVDSDRGLAALAALIGDIDAFFATHWASRPLLRCGGDAAWPRSLLSIADIDALLTERAPRLPAARLVRDGATVPTARYTTSARIGSTLVGDLLDPALITGEFASGSTVSLQGLHRYWPPLTDLCQSLEAALTHPFQANAYLSPAGAIGLNVHHDTHDVFVLQVEGSKHFDVYEPATWLPVAGQHWTSTEPPGEPVISVDLLPGDCLYMPRGWRHRAFTTESHSLHLTIGLLGYTWLGLMSAVSSALALDPAFRESLPPGFAHDPDAFAPAVADRLAALRDWLDSADPAELADTLVRRFVTAKRPRSAGFSAVINRTAVEPDDAVRRVPGSRCLVRPAADRIELVLADRVISFPHVAASVLRAVLTEPVFAAADLPGDLDLAGRLVVVRRLVAEGLLEAG